MIYYFTPYSVTKDYLQAIDKYMSLISDEDWACIMDADTAFLRPDFGVKILEYVIAYPEAGLFTCYASRCHYSIQVRRGTDMHADSILYHKRMSDDLDRTLHMQIKEIDRHIAGHLMLIKKTTWMQIRDKVFRDAKNKKILGVDTKISNAILSIGKKILLMRGIYLLHYCRMEEGFNYKKHLM